MAVKRPSALPRSLRSRFVVALVAGPVVWLGLHALGKPVATDPAWPLREPVIFLQLVLLFPLVEEWIFRGWIQGELRRFAGLRRGRLGLTRANLLTSALFAALHLLAQPAPAALLVFFPSLVFGYFRDRTARLPVSIWLHAWYNAGFGLWFMSP